MTNVFIPYNISDLTCPVLFDRFTIAPMTANLYLRCVNVTTGDSTRVLQLWIRSNCLALDQKDMHTRTVCLKSLILASHPIHCLKWPALNELIQNHCMTHQLPEIKQNGWLWGCCVFQESWTHSWRMESDASTAGSSSLWGPRGGRLMGRSRWVLTAW